MALDSQQSAVPHRIGKYRVLRAVAQGGMAEIFLATASGIEGFERLCIIKRILPSLADNDEMVQMFLDEARIAASFHHSNITQVFDIGADEGRHYFVMEFLRGEDLYHVLKAEMRRGRPIPLEHIVTIMTGVCAALHYAHELRDNDGKALQIVHRDVSPQNVFVTHDGNVKLCDFGIAKSTAKQAQTRVGTIKGKVRYMSPEQCQAEPVDRRSDLFSLAIVFWELLTLRYLHNQKTDLETFIAITSEAPPPPSRLRADIPPALDAIVLKALSKERQDRYQTAQALQLALEQWARSVALPTSPVGLASYMTKLFGAPEATLDTLLDPGKEGDPLSLRVRALNQHRESSDSAGAPLERPVSGLDPTVPIDAALTASIGASTREKTTPRVVDLDTGASTIPQTPVTAPPTFERHGAARWAQVAAALVLVAAMATLAATRTAASSSASAPPAAAPPRPPGEAQAAPRKPAVELERPPAVILAPSVAPSPPDAPKTTAPDPPPPTPPRRAPAHAAKHMPMRDHARPSEPPTMPKKSDAMLPPP